MKVRVAGVVFVMVALLAACGSSSSPSTDTSPPPDADVQAATACKAMEQALKDTADGTPISGNDAKDFQTTAGLLIRTPDGRPPTTLDAIPKWYVLGRSLVSLYTAVASQEQADIDTYTTEARKLCATIPEAAQQTAKYTPAPTTP